MEIKIFKEYLSGLAQLSQQSETNLFSRMKTLHLDKGAQILFPGEMCRNLYFITEGFFRIYSYASGQDITVEFFGPGSLMTSLESFYNRRRGNEGIVCEQPGKLLQFNYYDWRALEDQSPDFLFLSNAILKQNLLRKNQEVSQLRGGSSKQNFLELQRRFPQINRLVSQKHIASYLGISEPTMSGILKDLLFQRNY